MPLSRNDSRRRESALRRRVRQLRKIKGVSQEAFAHAIKIDRSYFGSIERGERNVSLENICLIAEGLGVAPPSC